MEELLGGRTRFAILEALTEAEGGRPMTAWKIAVTKGLNPSLTYNYIADLLKFGVVEQVTKGNAKQTSYRLSGSVGNAAAVFLRALKQSQRTLPAVIDLDEWMSPAMQAQRTVMIGNDRVPPKISQVQVKKVRFRRKPEELSALIESSQIAFRELFDKKDGVYILKE